MKKTIPDCISSLAEDDFSILERIIEFQYRKLLCMYWIINEYLEDISSLDYIELEDGSELEVNLVIDASAKKLKEMIGKMEDNVPDGWDVKFKGKKGNLSIHIVREEKDLITEEDEV